MRGEERRDQVHLAQSAMGAGAVGVGGGMALRLLASVQLQRRRRNDDLVPRRVGSTFLVKLLN